MAARAAVHAAPARARANRRTWNQKKQPTLLHLIHGMIGQSFYSMSTSLYRRFNLTRL
jgi:hypothetical protein